MNKMLRALKKLQATAASAGVRPQRAASAPELKEAPVRTSPAEAEHASTLPANAQPTPAGPKLDLAGWLKPTKPAYVMQEVARQVDRSPPAEPVISPAIPSAPPVPPPVAAPQQRPAGYESPWERAARNDLSTPTGFDAYRAIAQQIRRDLPGTTPRTVLLAGVGCGDNDVAESALRIAMIMAVDGRATLLVDAEPAHPLTDALVAERQPGLGEALFENVPAKHFLLPTSTTDLKFFPAGGSLTQINDRDLASLPMSEIVEQLRSEASLTIITAGDAESSLARAFGRSCDATYLLVRLGIATAGQAYQARTVLQENGARLLGCIAIEGA